MEFSMKLNPLPFSMIASGEKTFELRLYDEKRQKIAVGDTIRFTVTTMSSFDGGTTPSEKVPESFYHGLVLGLLVEQKGTYTIRSNRESGYGRYDVVMEPKDSSLPAVILEFKLFSSRRGEKTKQSHNHRSSVISIR